MRGPIDYIIAGFEGNKFDGNILAAIAEAIDSGAIALVALSLLTKDELGSISIIDITQSGDDFIIDFVNKYAPDNSLITQDDTDEVAELLENNTSAGLLIIEQLWAKPLKKALIDANGVLVAEGRIHPDAAFELTSKEN